MDSATWKSDFEAKKPPVDKAVNTIRAIFMQICLFLSLLTMIPKNSEAALADFRVSTGDKKNGCCACALRRFCDAWKCRLLSRASSPK